MTPFLLKLILVGFWRKNVQFGYSRIREMGQEFREKIICHAH